MTARWGDRIPGGGGTIPVSYAQVHPASRHSLDRLHKRGGAGLEKSRNNPSGGLPNLSVPNHPSGSQNHRKRSLAHGQASLEKHAAALLSQAKYMPPLTSSTWPVMYPASSLARKTMAEATARGQPMRPNGMRVFKPSFTASESTSVMGVSMKPGATAFTVMFREAISIAMALVNPIRPALAAT